MIEINNELKKVELNDNSLGITRGYVFKNKDGNIRYYYDEAYYENNDKICRKRVTEQGEFYYNVELVDIVVETFIMKDGNKGQKIYPLSEVAYLADDYNSVNKEVLLNFLSFKLHR